MILGCHLSIAGGLHHALEKAAELRLDAVAMFLRNQQQWRAPPLGEEAVDTFRQTRSRLNIGPVVAHGSYLLNLAGSTEVRDKSLEALLEDYRRCGRLGIEYLVIHPGAHGDAEAGVRLIAEGLSEVLAADRDNNAMILLETTAGGGSLLCGRFEQIAEVIRLCRRREKLGVCLDTCHVFAAGYDIRTPQAYRRTMAEFDGIIGLDRLRAVHLNDSKKSLGSHVDRHEHVGQGQLGAAGLANIVNDRRLAKVPMILETPKGLRQSDGWDWDDINAEAVRSLLKKPVPARRRRSPPADSAGPARA